MGARRPCAAGSRARDSHRHGRATDTDIPGPLDHDYRWRTEERDARTGDLAATFVTDPSIMRDCARAVAVGPFGLLQSFADGLKVFLQETIIPSAANKGKNETYRRLNACKV